MSHDGDERFCFMVAERDVTLDDAVKRLRAIISGRRKPPPGVVLLEWQFGYGENRSIADALAELVKLPWVDLDDESMSLRVIEAADVGAALAALGAVVGDDDKLAARVWELTEDDVDVSSIALADEGNDRTGERLVCAAKLLEATLQRARIAGGGLLIGMA